MAASSDATSSISLKMPCTLLQTQQPKPPFDAVTVTYVLGRQFFG